MPGRRVSLHSKANTLPLTVTLPSFRSSIFMGMGLFLMGFPIRTLPTTGLPPPDAGAAWGTGRGTSGALQVTWMSTLEKP